MDRNALYIDVKVYAGAEIPNRASPQMVALADRLGISVWAELNGISTVAQPGDDPAALAAAWLLAGKAHRRTASATDLARGSLTGDDDG